MLQSDKQAQLEQEIDRLTTLMSSSASYPAGTEERLEKALTELAVLNIDVASESSTPVKPKDVQVKLESKGQSNSDKGKSESKGKAEIKGSSGITSELSEDLSEAYKASMFLDERHIQKLARFEYARLSGQSLSASEGDFNIIWVMDQSLVESDPTALAEVNSQRIQDGITGAIGGKPTFLGASNYRHWAIIALLPSGDNGEVSIYYINSAYGKGAEGYFGCKAVGLTLCQNIVNQVNSRSLKDKRARPEIQAEHLYLEPTQQIENNCGAVAGLNIGGIAAWHRARRLNQTQDALEVYLGRLEYNQVLATRDTQSFEELVRARFVGIRTTAKESVLVPTTITGTAVATLNRMVMNAIYYAAIQVQISQDKETAEKMESGAIVGIVGEFDIAQQIALFEYYTRLKAGLEKGKSSKGGDSKGNDDDLTLDEDLKGITLEDQLHEEEAMDLKKAIEGIDKLLTGKEYDKVRIEIKKALQFCNRGINKGKYAADEYDLFIRLGDIYLHHGEVYDVPKAAAIYQYVKKLVEKHLKNDLVKLKNIEARIQSVETVFLERIKAPKAETKTRELKGRDIAAITSTKEYIARLEEHREHVKKRLAEIENLGIVDGQEELDEEGLQKRANGIEAIYGETREFFIGQRNEAVELTHPGLVNRLINDCIRELGGLPRVGADKHECAYSIFGMGSLALGTITPWSDLEFGILIEEGLPKEEEDRVKECFRRLTTLLHIKVVNFGETPLRMMGVIELNNFKITEKSDAEYNWFFDDLTRSGFSFDGPHWHACKTPLGRTKGYQKVVTKEATTEYIPCVPYELIGTVREFTGFYQNTTWVQADSQLVQGLGHIVLISGQGSLILRYQDMLRGQREVIESLAFRLLKEDSELLDPVTCIFIQEEGQIINVKKQVYRFSDRIIVALGDCLGESGVSNWQLVKDLKKVNDKTKKGLKLALAIATETRLRTYANNDGQREDMSVLAAYNSKLSELEKENLSRSIFHFKNLNILFRLYFILLGLSVKFKPVKTVGELDKWLDFQAKEPFQHIIMGQIYKRFLKYYDAIKEFESFEKIAKEKSIDYSELQGFINQILAELYGITGRYDLALQRCQEIQKSKKKDSESQIRSYQDMGALFRILGRYSEALTYLQDSLQTMSPTSEKDQYEATSIYNLALTLYDLSRPLEALEHMKKGFKIICKICQGDHIEIAKFLKGIGNMLQNLGNYEKALKYLKKSISMYSRIHKGDHEDISGALSDTSVTLHMLGKDIEAQKYAQEALAMMGRLYKGDHPNIATSLNNIGTILKGLDKYDEALKYQLESLAMRRRIYKGDHRDIASSLDNIGNVSGHLNRHEEAITYHREGLEMMRRIFPGNHTEVAICLINFANELYQFGLYHEALKHFEECLQMSRAIYQKDHMDIARSLVGKATILIHLKRYHEAFVSQQEALEMQRRIYKGDHTDIATTLSNIGTNLVLQTKYQEALKYHIPSLAMRRRIYKKAHPRIAESLECMGATLLRLNRDRDSLPYLKECVIMMRSFPEKDNNKFITILNALASALQKLKMYKKSLPYFQEVLKLEKLVHQNNTVNAIKTLQSIGFNLTRLGRYEEGLEHFQESLDLSSKVFKQGKSIEIAVALNNAGNALRKLGRWQESFDNINKALAMFVELLPSYHANIATAREMLSKSAIGLANERMLLGQNDEALVLYLTYIEGFESENLVGLIHSLARNFHDTGEISLSISCYEVLSKVLEPSDRGVKHNLACAYHVQAMGKRRSGRFTEYQEFLNKTGNTFLEALNVESDIPVRASLYVEYSMFLLIYHDAKDMIAYSILVGYLGEAINLRVDNSMLSYNQIAKPTIIKALQELLNDQDNVVVSPYILALYLQVKVHRIHNARDLEQQATDELLSIAMGLEGTFNGNLANSLLSFCQKEKLERGNQAATVIQRSWKGFSRTDTVTTQLHNVFQPLVCIMAARDNKTSKMLLQSLPHNHISIIWEYYAGQSNPKVKYNTTCLFVMCAEISPVFFSYSIYEKGIVKQTDDLSSQSMELCKPTDLVLSYLGKRELRIRYELTNVFSSRLALLQQTLLGNQHIDIIIDFLDSEMDLSESHSSSARKGKVNKDMEGLSISMS